jgi:hypothetical protein
VCIDLFLKIQQTNSTRGYSACTGKIGLLSVRRSTEYRVPCARPLASSCGKELPWTLVPLKACTVGPAVLCGVVANPFHD